MLSTLLKKSKTYYYNQYFKANISNIKNTWKGIKSIITIKNLSSDLPKSLSSNGSTIKNPVEFSNVFNSYFATIAEKTKENINLSHKYFSDLLKNRHHNSFFLSPTSKSEILSAISSLDSNKSVGPKSIPIKILKLLKNIISSKLADIFNISFSTGVFPTILKVVKVVPVYKKTLNWTFQTIDQFHCYTILKKILEKLMYNRVYNFFTKSNRKQCVSINGHVSNKASVNMANHKVQFLGHFCS